MGRQINGGLVAIIVFLIAGSLIFPDGAGMWLASTSPMMNAFRAALLLGAVALLVTEPPRNKLPRGMLSLLAMVLFGWAIARTFDGTVQIIDAMVALLASVSFAIASLENAETPVSQPRLVQTLKPVPSIFATNVLAVSDMQGMVIAQNKIRNKIRETALFLAIAVTAFYQGPRPYRSLWRGG